MTYEKLQVQQDHRCFPSPPLGDCHTALSHTDLTTQAQAHTLLPLQNCSPVKHAPFLVGCRWTPTSLFKLNTPTPLLAHIVKNQDCQGYQEPVCDILIKYYYCHVGRFIEPTLVRTFSLFPLWDLAFVHKHSTLKSFTVPHTSTIVIQTAERWERLRVNCSCIKSFISNIYCCFLLLPTAVRG